jgi:pimeloyl-ACP methyl ester carboxylesterase
MIDMQLHTRLSAAESDELVELLTNPSLEDAKQLRAHLGPESFQRMRSLALRKAIQLREAGDYSNGNVLFVPAMLHNELSVRENGQNTPIWMSAQAVSAGHLQQLRLDSSGLADANPRKPIVVSGLMKRYCGELVLTLAQNWKVRTFAYDWRKSLTLAATQLQARIDACFPAQEPMHIVAVGEGGIVALLYIALYRNQWKARGGRLVTIGTPFLGSPLYLQALAGHLDIVQWMDMVDPYYKRDDYLALLHTFPSIYQLLPFADASYAALFKARTYGNLTTIRQEYLDSARDVQQLLRSAIDPTRMLAVVGYGQPSFAHVDLPEFSRAMVQRRPGERPDRAEMKTLYKEMTDGDGDVALRCTEMRTDAGEMVPTLYVDASVRPTCSAPALSRALDELLQIDVLSQETTSAIAGKHRIKKYAAQNLVLEGALESSDDDRQRVKQLTRRLKRMVNAPEGSEVTENERILEGLLMRHLGVQTKGSQRESVQVSFPPPSIAIEAILGDVSKIDELAMPAPAVYPDGPLLPTIPVDAITVGHYLGSAAQSGLAALDEAIRVCMAQRPDAVAEEPLSRQPLLLEDLLQRGTIRGELANIFLLPDPRPDGIAAQRLLAIAGMGVPGRFGAPELVILVRELCWTLGRIGKKHLVAVLIGAGQNNLNVSEAVEAWVRGIKLAITGAEPTQQLQQITFVEYNPQRLAALDRRVQQLATDLAARRRMFIGHTPLDIDEQMSVRNAAMEQIRKQMEQHLNAVLDDALPEMVASTKEDEGQGLEIRKQPPPIRIAVEYDGETYRFGAITQNAAVADRQIPLDARIVNQANDRLASITELDEQKEQGEFLAKFLFPDDFHANLSGGSPIVLTLDSSAARIHWELLCLSEQQILRQAGGSNASSSVKRELSPDLDLFLGTACGLTRQLRTPFARPPEPIPQQKRLLRVLVVADPAADARLPGAEEEGNAVADLLELYNLLTASENRIEVVRLIGPVEATRVSVLQHLMTRSYDVLHFAGHCVYDAERPRASGWIFSGGERLTANEIQRVDRVPSLVVSNACESGIVPERSGARAAALAPTFAETFFARGVSNFVCTAWPVGDREARDFALTLYAALLGLKFDETKLPRALRTDSHCYSTDASQPFHVAMRNARRAIAAAPYDRHSWGAYQHYGNPYARLFAP